MLKIEEPNSIALELWSTFGKQQHTFQRIDEATKYAIIMLELYCAPVKPCRNPTIVKSLLNIWPLLFMWISLDNFCRSNLILEICFSLGIVGLGILFNMLLYYFMKFHLHLILNLLMTLFLIQFSEVLRFLMLSYLIDSKTCAFDL